MSGTPDPPASQAETQTNTEDSATEVVSPSAAPTTSASAPSSSKQSTSNREDTSETENNKFVATGPNAFDSTLNKRSEHRNNTEGSNVAKPTTIKQEACAPLQTTSPQSDPMEQAKQSERPTPTGTKKRAASSPSPSPQSDHKQRKASQGSAGVPEFLASLISRDRVGEEEELARLHRLRELREKQRPEPFPARIVVDLTGEEDGEGGDEKENDEKEEEEEEDMNEIHHDSQHATPTPKPEYPPQRTVIDLTGDDDDDDDDDINLRNTNHNSQHGAGAPISFDKPPSQLAKYWQTERKYLQRRIEDLENARVRDWSLAQEEIRELRQAQEQALASMEEERRKARARFEDACMRIRELEYTLEVLTEQKWGLNRVEGGPAQ
ncbi:hypothetical protein BJX61DRAFT_369555 [Aspergillus egyptiacus]|nr:hypothetical protein BJX61DRAFT_369555 [Aspergillus egyptiacus]